MVGHDKNELLYRGTVNVKLQKCLVSFCIHIYGVHAMFHAAMW